MTATAFVLAAGLGTRLRPLTEHLPKPLVPVCGVPLLSWSLALAARHGLTEVVVNGHWLAEELEPWEGEHEGVVVRLSIERPDILGTGGGLKAVEDQLAEQFVVLNGDVLHTVDLTELLKAVPPGGAAMALRPDPEQAPRYGIVAADASGTVTRLTSLASAPAEGAVREDTHFTGIHALDRRALALVPEGFACVVRSAYVGLVPKRNVGSIRYDGPWLDCGDPEAYLQTNLSVLRGEVVGALDPFARAAYARGPSGDVGDPGLLDGVEVAGHVWIGAGAQVGRGACLEDCVIGAGAVVEPGVRLARSVVWDGVKVQGSAERIVAIPGEVVRV